MKSTGTDLLEQASELAASAGIKVESAYAAVEATRIAEVEELELELGSIRIESPLVWRATYHRPLDGELVVRELTEATEYLRRNVRPR